MATPTAAGIGTTSTVGTPAGHGQHRASPLTAEYRKAHKNYVLVAGLLASWELIGINLDTKGKWGIELTSPKAVPLILFTLLVYCAYKVFIEWQQCDAERRSIPAAKIDYYVGHLIALAAVSIGAVQYGLRIRIVDILTGDFASNTTNTAFGCMMSTLLFVQLISKWKQHSTKVTLATVVILAVFIGAAIKYSVFGLGTQHHQAATYALGAGAIIGILLAIWARNHDPVQFIFQEFSKGKAAQSAAAQT